MNLASQIRNSAPYFIETHIMHNFECMDEYGVDIYEKYK